MSISMLVNLGFNILKPEARREVSFEEWRHLLGKRSETSSVCGKTFSGFDSFALYFGRGRGGLREGRGVVRWLIEGILKEL